MFQHLAAVLVAATSASAAQLYNGAQKTVLSPNMPSACDSAFNTTLSCPDNVLQFLTYPNIDVGMSGTLRSHETVADVLAWNTSTLAAMCTTACKSSLVQLKTAVTSGCSTDSFNFNSANMTYVDVVDLIQYKFGQVCLADASSGQYCSDIEKT